MCTPRCTHEVFCRSLQNTPASPIKARPKENHHFSNVLPKRHSSSLLGGAAPACTDKGLRCICGSADVRVSLRCSDRIKNINCRMAKVGRDLGRYLLKQDITPGAGMWFWQRSLSKGGVPVPSRSIQLCFSMSGHTAPKPEHDVSWSLPPWRGNQHLEVMNTLIFSTLKLSDSLSLIFRQIMLFL